jgi:hypothetical protein
MSHPASANTDSPARGHLLRFSQSAPPVCKAFLRGARRPTLRVISKFYFATWQALFLLYRFGFARLA